MAWISWIFSKVMSAMTGDSPKRGLIEHQKTRLKHQAAAHGEHLLLAAAHRSGELLAALRQHGENRENQVERARPRSALALGTYAPISRFSFTVISGKTCRPSGTWAMPSAVILYAGSEAIPSPKM